MPHVYSLTPLTGRRRNSDRRMVVATVEVRQRPFIISIISAVASAPVTGIMAIFVGVWCLIVPPLFIVAGIWLWDARQRRGLHLLNYQAILDRRRATTGVLYAAGRPIHTPQLVIHHPQTLPAETAARTDTPVARGVSDLSKDRPRASARRRSRLESRVAD